MSEPSEKCGDVFELVMHEMIFVCALPRGHSGPHGCAETGEEQSPSDSDERGRRVVRYSAEWSDEK